MIRGLAAADVEAIVAARGAGPFASVDEFARRTGLSAAVIGRLARADGFASLAVDRRTALWESLPIRPTPPLLGELPYGEPAADLPAIGEYEQVAADYRATSLSLRAHPLSFVRDELERRGVVRAVDLATHEVDRRVRVAGLVLLRQRPGTAKGITFVTLEDETGTANLVIHPGTWDRFRRAARHAVVLQARGRLQREGPVIHVVVDGLEDVGSLLSDVDSRSRDFR
jgi:error-prone DNA polymerase